MNISELHIKVLKNGMFSLLYPIHYEMEDRTVIVHKGFVWDGASIPRELWSVVGCPSQYLYESCLHDALYASCVYSRKDSDKMFHSALIAMGVDYFTAKSMYLAVRVGGDGYYGKKNKSQAREFISVDFKNGGKYGS